MHYLKNFLSYLFVFIAFYALVCFNTFQCDDLRFAMSLDGGRVSGWIDAIKAQYPEYLTWSGRYLVQVLGRYTAGVLGGEVARVISSFFFTLLCFFMLKLANQEKQTLLLPILGGMILLLLPNIDGTFIGNLVGAVNYLWTAVFNLGFIIWIINVIEKEKSIGIRWVSFIVSILIGSLQESFSIGIAAALFFYWCLNVKTLTQSFKIAVIGYWLGTAFLVFGPGNFGRLAITADHSSNYLIVLLSRLANVLLHLRMTWILIVSIIIHIGKDKSILKGFIQENFILLVSIAFNLLFCVVVAFAGAHQLTCIEIMSAILLIKIIMTCSWFADKSIKRVSYTFTVIIALLFVPIIQARSDAHNAYERMLESAYAPNDGCFVSDRFDSISYSDMGYFYDRFVQSELNANTPLDALSRYVTNSSNTEYLKTKLPKPKQEIIAMCREELKVDECLFFPGSYYYIVRLPIGSSYTGLKVCQRNSLFGSIKNRILGAVDDNHSVSFVSLDGLDSFEDSGYCYYVYRFCEEFPIVNICLI